MRMNDPTPTLRLDNGDVITAETLAEYLTTPRPFGTLTPEDYRALAMFSDLLTNGMRITSHNGSRT
jgi:hypothetical protein